MTSLLAILHQLRTEPIDAAWCHYTQCLTKVKWNGWQYQCCFSFINQPQNWVWNWCRDSGKTEKATALYIFCAIRGIQPYWFAATTNQLTRMQEHCNQNPFVQPFRVSHVRKQCFLVDGTRVGFNVLSVQNASGLHPDVIFYDEVALMSAEAYGKSLAMLNHQAHPQRLLISTPTLGSLFHQVVLDTTHYTTVTKTYLDCHWMNAASIEAQQLKGWEWQWEQEQLCRFVLPSGAVFKNIVLVDTLPILGQNRYQGVDFNGFRNSNVGVRVSVDGTSLFLLQEQAFQYKTDDDLLQQWCQAAPTEVESGGWNDTYAPNLRGVTKRPFTEETKIAMIRQLSQYTIYVNAQLTPKTLEHLRKAAWGENGKVDTHDLHFLAALLHAIPKPQAITIPQKKSNVYTGFA